MARSRLKVFILEDEIKKAPRSAILKVMNQLGAKLEIAMSADEAKAKFKPPYDLVLLDHDMEGYYNHSDVPNCGYQFLKWSLEQGHWHLQWVAQAKVIIHSQNSEGARKMKRLLEKHGFEAQTNPFWSGFPDWLHGQLVTT